MWFSIWGVFMLSTGLLLSSGSFSPSETAGKAMIMISWAIPLWVSIKTSGNIHNLDALGLIIGLALHLGLWLSVCYLWRFAKWQIRKNG